MFSLNGAVKYKYIPNYQDMRGGYDKLCGVIRSLGEDLEDGTAYVFTSKDQKIVKIIRHEHNECQMYYQKFDKNMSFVRLECKQSLRAVLRTLIKIYTFAPNFKFGTK